ncbi:MAG: hypothetical protein IJJ41_01305 [Clostridia bacterium]|nr:hypothetical protein [Clostridia bacterium]
MYFFRTGKLHNFLAKSSINPTIKNNSLTCEILQKTNGFEKIGASADSVFEHFSRIQRENERSEISREQEPAQKTGEPSALPEDDRNKKCL